MTSNDQESNKGARQQGGLFSLLQSVRANTYGQMILRNKMLFGFFYKDASYMLERSDDTTLRLLGFIGYVPYSVEFGSLRRHKTFLTIEEVNAEAIANKLPARFYVTPRQMICYAYEGSIDQRIEDSKLSVLLSFVVEALLCSASLTSRISAYVIPSKHLRSL